MKKIDFNKYLFRASQSSQICTGNIGLTDVQEAKLQTYLERQDQAKKGEAKELTPNMVTEMKSLLEEKNNPTMPKSLQTTVRKIYRSEKYARNFEFTNKFVQKGIHQEEEAISLYMDYRNLNGKKTFFRKNDKRLFNDWISGEPDLSLGNDIETCDEGFDTKCSYTLETFPFEDDSLDDNYEWQNQCYMWLTGAKKWTTAYCLVNCTEHQLHLEKQKWFYALGLHDTAGKSDKVIERLENNYEEKARSVEKMLIYDYDRFVKVNPGHLMSYTKEEWFGEELDIPIKERIIEKVSIYDEEKIKFLKSRIEISRKYLIELNNKK